MKRLPPYKKRDYGISKFFPLLFWKECGMCGNEFVREWMWKVVIPTDIETIIACNDGWFYPFYDYLCNNCCKDRDDVISYRNKFRKGKNENV